MNLKEVTKDRTISLRIESNLLVALNKLSAREKKSKSEIIQNLILIELQQKNISLKEIIAKNQTNIFNSIK